MGIHTNGRLTDGMKTNQGRAPLESRTAQSDSGNGGPDNDTPADDKRTDDKTTHDKKDDHKKDDEKKPDNKNSGFPPPDEPIMVFCMHCGKEYMSSEMVPPNGKRTAEMRDGFWWCATPGCNAGGFGLDVFPVDPEWKDPKGLLHIVSDTDDDEEFEWDDEEE